MIVPMHGEHRMLREHTKLAEAAGIPAIIATNGMMLDLSGNRPNVVEHIDVGRTYLDGTRQIGAMDGVVRDRIKLALNGLVIVTLIIDDDDEVLGDPWVELRGLPETGQSNAGLAEVLEADISQALARSDDEVFLDDDKLEEVIRRAARQSAQSEIGRKPEVTVITSRLA